MAALRRVSGCSPRIVSQAGFKLLVESPSGASQAPVQQQHSRRKCKSAAVDRALNPPFHFVTTNSLPTWPRSTGMTEVRGPFTNACGKHVLTDLLDTVGPAIDGFKFVGGELRALTRSSTIDLIETAHAQSLYVCESGLLQHALTQGPKAVRRYVQECQDLHIDTVELPDACADVLNTVDYMMLLEDLQDAGLQPRPKVGVWFAAGTAGERGYLRERAFNHHAMSTADDAILKAKQCLERGADLVTVDCLSLPGDAPHQWREAVVRQLVAALGLDKIMFEAPHPEVFRWFVDMFPDANLHVDFSQVVQLQCMRQGVLYPPQVSLTYGGMAVDYEDELECEDEAGHFL